MAWDGDVVGTLGCAPGDLDHIEKVLALVRPAERLFMRRYWSIERYGRDYATRQFRVPLDAAAAHTLIDTSRPIVDADGKVAVIAGAWQADANGAPHPVQAAS
ncbi:hypothetical protein [Paraherbaspirillum soli]|uniref:PAS fold-4 domain-containing protein n=1 Tax=Paraherbaspirillum soli TaxID=631222 RepID=A0ABW0MD99_9BURK